MPATRSSESKAANPAGPGMQRGSRFVYTTSGLKTVATEWPAPAGMVLDGFEVIPCGGGGAGGANGGGEGGKSPRSYLTLAEMGSPATIQINIGAGGVSAGAGGDTDFGGFAYGRGGKGNGLGSPPAQGGVLLFGSASSNQEWPLVEGWPGFNTTQTAQLQGAGSKDGFCGGGGGAYDSSGGQTGSGGAVRPLFKGLGPGSANMGVNSAVTSVSAIANFGGDNPSAASGAAGHAGVGDYPGGGGNGHASPASAGVGGFPGGGGGGASSAASNGAAGRCIVYPWFKKA